MSDNSPPANTPPAEEDDLTKALADLAELVKPVADGNKVGMDAFYYLLLLWASFHIYPLEPSPEESSGIAKITKLENGWKIFDYGDCLSLSPGENYGSYCTGKLIDAVHEVIKMLVERGVTKVGFLGHDVARRAAWIDCLESNINIINYDPNDFDWEVRYRILEARKEADKKVKQRVQKLKEQRPE